MKTLYLFRESYDAKYILSALTQRNIVTTIVLEKGTHAKKEKLIRVFKKSSIFRYPLIFIDITALVIYSSYVISCMKKILGEYEYPQGKIKLIVEDANDRVCIDFIKKNNPDVVFIYGTAIIRKEFLQEIKCPIFNIHSGILPRYRNVHSDFWAFKNKDYNNIGVSIIYLDGGIDSGDIAIKNNISYIPGDSLVTIKVKNLKLIPDLVSELLQQLRHNKVKRIKQDKLKSDFYQTPNFRNLIGFVFRKQ